MFLLMLINVFLNDLVLFSRSFLRRSASTRKNFSRVLKIIFDCYYCLKILYCVLDFLLKVFLVFVLLFEILYLFVYLIVSTFFDTFARFEFFAFSRLFF